MNILYKINNKKSENIIFMAYCYKLDKEMKDESILKKTDKKLIKILNKYIPELNYIEPDITTLKLIYLLRFIIFKIYSKKSI